MVAEIPLEAKQDPYATFLDPSCGDGNFLVALLEELSKFHDPYWALIVLATDSCPEAALPPGMATLLSGVFSGLKTTNAPTSI